MKRHILAANEHGCMMNCGDIEDVNHLYVNCDFFGRIWYFISNWLGFYTTINDGLEEHITHFGSLEGFSHKVRNSLNVIWLSVAWTIWKERIRRVFSERRIICRSCVKGWSFSHVGGLSRHMFCSILITNYGGLTTYIAH